MTRKDYQLIATVLKNFATEGRPVDDRDEIAMELSKALAIDNPRFDRDKFLIAAGYYQETIRKVLTHIEIAEVK